MLSGRPVRRKEPDTGSSRIHGMDFTWESLVVPHQQRTILALSGSRSLADGTSSPKVRMASLIGESSGFGYVSGVIPMSSVPLSPIHYAHRIFLPYTGLNLYLYKPDLGCSIHLWDRGDYLWHLWRFELIGKTGSPAAPSSLRW
jgi:hypothetical protein